MNNYTDKLQKLIDEVKNTNIIKTDDFPNINLYMDQITTFMDSSLNEFKRYNKDKILTKTMINNYAKAKILPPPIKKKYNKNHMMLLVIIYHLKSIISINDINKLLKPITDELNINENSETLEKVYIEFTKLQNLENQNIFDSLIEQNNYLNSQSIGSIMNKDKIYPIISILNLAIQANKEKRLAEKILDNFL